MHAGYNFQTFLLIMGIACSRRQTIYSFFMAVPSASQMDDFFCKNDLLTLCVVGHDRFDGGIVERNKLNAETLILAVRSKCELCLENLWMAVK